jgi:hypothetical protein
MKTIRLFGLFSLLTLISINNSSCQKDDEEGGSNFPSLEWYESIIPHGTFQYENISDVSAVYISYSFYVNHSFVKYTKSANRTMTTDSDGSKTYTKWEVKTNETKRGTWELNLNHSVPELQLSYDDGRSDRINLYNLHNRPDSFEDDNGHTFKREYDDYVGPSF